MTWVQAIFTYLLTWWIVWIAVLPFGVKREPQPEAGHSAGAPQNPYLGRKLLATSLISLLVVTGIAALLNSGVMEIRNAIPTD